MKKLLIISILFISLFGCRSINKKWLEENYIQKLEARDITKEEVSKIVDEKTSVINNLVASVLENQTATKNNESQNVNETTSVSGTIEAEPGVIKTASIGDTKIKSDGTNISFEVNTSKAISKAFESYKTEFDSYRKETSETIKMLQSDLIQKSQTITELNQKIDAFMESQSKDKNKSGLSFGATLSIIGGILLLIGLVLGYFYVKNKLGWFV